ncbi:hypothetical protein [Flavobacterium mesophilum]|uniref:hypothetical protein n=1 Tax=Flavobacterium mesophilum TaxID=3143495 RepID=UPI0031DEEE7F
MKKEKLLKVVLGLLFFSISFIAFENYLHFKSSLVNNKPLAYLFIDKRINKGGRGESYEMDFLYKKQMHSISITGNEYDLIEKGQYPDLYLTKNKDDIFSKWSLKMSFRIALLFFLLFVLTVLPYSFIINLFRSVKTS